MTNRFDRTDVHFGEEEGVAEEETIEYIDTFEGGEGREGDEEIEGLYTD